MPDDQTEARPSEPREAAGAMLVPPAPAAPPADRTGPAEHRGPDHAPDHAPLRPAGQRPGARLLPPAGS